MTKIKKYSLAAVTGAALALVLAGPAAASGGDHAAGDHARGDHAGNARQGNALTIIGPGTICDAQGFVLILPGDCDDAPLVDVSDPGDQHASGRDDGHGDGNGPGHTPPRP
ncbi:MAG: hypothetical protein WCA46_01785 [Actinocatenispora sp.]